MYWSKSENAEDAVLVEFKFAESNGIKATPHNPRLTPLHVICLPAFRHIAQILLDLRQQACVEFGQSDENLDGASDAQWSCGVALKPAISSAST